ncbi:MAG: sigma-70 family RNA polymerase sigma factor [Cytophagales bacterium]|nr:sigma-70 family RNA polymerase sigma factor [Cytophaga sp.]
MGGPEFVSLVMKEKSLLKSFALKLTMDPEEAKDLMQDTLLKAIRYKDKFINSTNLKGWLCVIMKNTFINSYRRSVRRTDLSGRAYDMAKDEIQSSVFHNSTDAQIDYKDIMKVINSLKDEFKIPFIRFVDGYKYKEISDELEIPIGTVKSRIFIARKEIMGKLKTEYSFAQ